jgi:hypothetical protein
MYDVAAGLARQGHEVTVLAINTPKHHQPADVLAHLPGVRLVTVDVDTRLSPVKALHNLLFSHLPYNVERFVSPAMQARLAELLEQETYDVVQMEGTFVAWYAGYWVENGLQRWKQLPPVVLRAHNVEYTIWEQLADNARNPLKKWYLRKLARRLQRFEHWMMHRFDAVAAITEADQQRLRQLGCQEPVVFVPAGVDLSRLQRDAAVRPRPSTPSWSCILPAKTRPSTSRSCSCPA